VRELSHHHERLLFTFFGSFKNFFRRRCLLNLLESLVSTFQISISQKSLNAPSVATTTGSSSFCYRKMSQLSC